MKNLKYVFYGFSFILILFGYHFLGHVYVSDDFLGDLSTWMTPDMSRLMIIIGFFGLMMTFLVSKDFKRLFLKMSEKERIPMHLKLIVFGVFVSYVITFFLTAFELYIFRWILSAVTIYLILKYSDKWMKVSFLFLGIYLVEKLSNLFWSDYGLLTEMTFFDWLFMIGMFSVYLVEIYLIVMVLVKWKDKEKRIGLLEVVAVQGLLLLAMISDINIFSVTYTGSDVLITFKENHHMYELLFFIGIMGVLLYFYRDKKNEEKRQNLE